jgi:hypothetical protein
MHDPIAVDKNWITALLCQQYYRHSQPPFVSGRSISGIWRPYRKSKRSRRESVRVGRSSASAVLLSVAPRGRPGRPCGGGGREDRLSSVLPELICYRRGHSPVPRPNSGMRSLGGRTWTQAALQARRSIDAQHQRGGPDFGRGPLYLLAASKSLQSSQAQNDPNANAQSAPRSASRLWGLGHGSVLRSLVWVEVLGRKHNPKQPAPAL